MNCEGKNKKEFKRKAKKNIHEGDMKPWRQTEEIEFKKEGEIVQEKWRREKVKGHQKVKM